MVYLETSCTKSNYILEGKLEEIFAIYYFLIIKLNKLMPYAIFIRIKILYSTASNLSLQ